MLRRSKIIDRDGRQGDSLAHADASGALVVHGRMCTDRRVGTSCSASSTCTAEFCTCCWCRWWCWWCWCSWPVPDGGPDGAVGEESLSLRWWRRVFFHPAAQPSGYVRMMGVEYLLLVVAGPVVALSHAAQPPRLAEQRAGVVGGGDEEQSPGCGSTRSSTPPDQTRTFPATGPA